MLLSSELVEIVRSFGTSFKSHNEFLKRGVSISYGSGDKNAANL